MGLASGVGVNVSSSGETCIFGLSLSVELVVVVAEEDGLSLRCWRATVDRGAAKKAKNGRTIDVNGAFWLGLADFPRPHKIGSPDLPIRVRNSRFGRINLIDKRFLLRLRRQPDKRLSWD